jgi:hypothetical protein
MRYCRALVCASPWLKLESYGTSGQGRDLPLLIVSKDRAGHAIPPPAGPNCQVEPVRVQVFPDQ